MNGLGRSFRKSDPKNEKKNSKNQCQNASCEQKNHKQERIFDRTPFSHYFGNLAKNTPYNHSLFRSTCFETIVYFYRKATGGSAN